MKTYIKVSILLASILSIVGCDEPNEATNSGSSEVNVSSSDNSSSGFSYSFPKKEQGLSLDEINAELDKMNPQPQEQRKVRYTYHVTEKLVGTYPASMTDGTQMKEGEYTLDMVTETRVHNLDTSIQVISGTPVTTNQRLYLTYTAAVTPKGWLSYHAQKRQFLNSAQEGEGFEERFYKDPLKLWMMSWGNRPANAQMDGTYFAYNEFERVYNTQGYCTTFMMKEFYYIKGTLTSFNNGSKYYDGTYEWVTNCTIEYLD